MPTTCLLDTGPLGLLAHDRPVHRIPNQTWLVQEMTAGATVYISEVADYEVRRELSRLIRAGQLPASRLAGFGTRRGLEPISVPGIDVSQQGIRLQGQEEIAG